MNHQELDELWDGCRDGALSAAERQRLDELLAQDDAARQLFDAETQWLTALTAGQLDPATAPQDDAFVESVLARWQTEPTGVLARINWRSALFSSGWAAAAAVVALIMWFNKPQEEDAQTPSGQVAQVQQFNPPSMAVNYGPRGFRRHPLTEIAQDFNQQYHQQPQAVIRMIDGARYWMDVEQLTDRLGIVPASQNAPVRVQTLEDSR